MGTLADFVAPPEDSIRGGISLIGGELDIAEYVSLMVLELMCNPARKGVTESWLVSR